MNTSAPGFVDPGELLAATPGGPWATGARTRSRRSAVSNVAVGSGLGGIWLDLHPAGPARPSPRTSAARDPTSRRTRCSRPARPGGTCGRSAPSRSRSRGPGSWASARPPYCRRRSAIRLVEVPGLADGVLAGAAHEAGLEVGGRGSPASAPGVSPPTESRSTWSHCSSVNRRYLRRWVRYCWMRPTKPPWWRTSPAREPIDGPMACGWERRSPAIPSHADAPQAQPMPEGSS